MHANENERSRIDPIRLNIIDCKYSFLFVENIFIMYDAQRQR